MNKKSVSATGSRHSAGVALSDEKIGGLVLRVRGHKVMLDSDLARLYGVPVKALNQAVKRNIERFPEDFMFQLTWEETENLIRLVDIENKYLVDNKGISDLKSQFVTSNLKVDKNQRVTLRPQFVTLKEGRGGKRYLPYAFTEQGIAMLSSVLKSKRAVQVNIAIMRAFVSLRGMMRSQETIKQELAALKRQYKDHDEQIKAIFLMIDEIIAPAPVKKRKIGFIHSKE